MGRYQAATAVAVIAAIRETIRSPGWLPQGNDRPCARDSELHLINSLWSLAHRDRSRGTYDGVGAEIVDDGVLAGKALTFLCSQATREETGMPRRVIRFRRP